MPTDSFDIGPSDNSEINGKLVSEGSSILTEDSSIFRLATTQLRIVEEPPGATFHLNFTLCCGTGEFPGANAEYEINLRQCFVEIATEGCDVSYSDAYSHQLSDDEIAIGYRDEKVAKHTERSEIGGGAEIKFSWRDRARIAFKGRISREKLSNEVQKRDIKGKQRIMLIGFRGTHWAVGHDEVGDPRYVKAGWLRGPYFHEEAPKPLCTIDVRKGAAEAHVTVAVRAKRGQLDVHLLDRTGRASYKAGPEYVDDWSTALRERLRGMAVAEALHDRQRGLYPALPPSEFELTQNTVCATLKMPTPDVSTRAPLADAEAKQPPRSKRTTRKP